MGARSAAEEIVDHEVLDRRQPSVAHLFRWRAERSAAETAYSHFEGEELVGLTWGQARETVWEWAAGLIALGVEPGDRVAIASSTRIEWVLADLAVMCAGAVTTTIYPNTLGPDVAYLLADSGARVAFAEDAAQLAKLREHREETPDLVCVVAFSDTDADGSWVRSDDDLSRLGRELLDSEPDAIDRRIDALGPEDLATIIYTSGTTGRPKGVELTHDSFVYVAASAASFGLMRPDDLQYLWLPLSHVFGKVLLTIPMQIGFPTAVDGRIDKIAENLAVVRPTWMGSAPRVFEKIKSRVTTGFADEPAVKRALIDWALGVGHSVAQAREQGRGPSIVARVQHTVADRIVLSKVRDRFGGRIRFFISGSAPLDPDVARWFAALGLLVGEGYGLTETSAFTCVNRTDAGGYAFGTVGWPAPGTEVKVAADGELLIRGPGVMRGYHGLPEATAQVLDADGFFATGDIGEIDERGFVTITDRKKDLFKTSGGKYIAPAHIEAQFKGLCPYVSQFVVLGEGRNYASALVTLDADLIAGWAEREGMPQRAYADLVTSPEVRELIQGYLDRLNSGLNRWETIKRFVILDRDLSVERDELTPSLKLKRKVVAAEFADRVEELYS